MRKAMRHTGVLMMLAVLALGLVGAAYTLWFEKLTVTATVETGILDVDLSCVNPEQPYVRDGVYNDCSGGGKTIIGKQLPHGAFLFHNASFFGKPPLECKSTLSDATDPEGENDPNYSKLDLFVGGAYPYAGCLFFFDIHNDGTVPVHLEAKFTNSSDSKVVFKHLGCFPLWNPEPNGVAGSVLEGATEVSEIEGVEIPAADVEADVETIPGTTHSYYPLGFQLHHSDELVCAIFIYPKQSADENTTYTATLEIIGYQWNEDFHKDSDHPGVSN